VALQLGEGLAGSRTPHQAPSLVLHQIVAREAVPDNFRIAKGLTSSVNTTPLLRNPQMACLSNISGVRISCGCDWFEEVHFCS
jgi:hypothetical protein